MVPSFAVLHEKEYMTDLDIRLLYAFAALGIPMAPQRSPWIHFGEVSLPGGPVSQKLTSRLRKAFKDLSPRSARS
jgi:hypothetical protein